MKRLLLLCLLISKNIFSQVDVNQFIQFTPTQREIGCMKNFQPKLGKNNIFNLYILAKLSETMYPERLDYMFRFFHNDRKPIDSIPSTAWLKKNPILQDSDFEKAFSKRFEHMFPKEDSVTFKYLFASRYLKNVAKKEKKIGLDPELVVISTSKYVIIVYRGTDMMEQNALGEWIGTDFNALKTSKCELFDKGRIHKGFNASIELIQPILESYLDQIKAKSKPIWVTGHSLGGSMAILSGIQLSKIGYSVEQIPVFAAPNSIGNKKFVSSIDNGIKSKIDRYEFNLDPFTILWTPGYTSFGKRNYILEDYSVLLDIPHRRLIGKNQLTKNIKDQRIDNSLFKKNIFKIPFEVYHHNPPWYTQTFYIYLTKEEKMLCPDLDDSFPFFYYGWSKSK